MSEQGQGFFDNQNAYERCGWNDEKATNDPMQVYITQQFESNQENNLLLTLYLYFQQIEHFKLG